MSAMHTVAPPKSKLGTWLKSTTADQPQFSHLLLEQQVPASAELIAALRPYFESAHLDARTVFHQYAGIDLHPDSSADTDNFQYPSCLPSVAKRGLFGEALCGLIIESYDTVGKRNWRIPAFLFRHHADARDYFFTLVRDRERKREVMGRHGNDFIAIEVDSIGSVVGFLAGEAKWRKSLTPGEINRTMDGDYLKGPDGKYVLNAYGQKVRSERGVWFELNREVNAPNGLRQLQEILKSNDPNKFAQTILSLDAVLTMNSPTVIQRTDLVLVCGNGSKSRKPGNTVLPSDGPPSKYLAGRELQIIEVVLDNGEQLIDSLYDSLWSD